MLKGIILSGGVGKRLDKYEIKPNVKLLGKRLIDYAYDMLKDLGIEDITIIKSKSLDIKHKACQIVQENPLGTANALSLIKDKGIFLVIPVDTPLLKSDTLLNMIEYHFKNKNDITVLSSRVKNSYGYGRIFKHPLRIKEEKTLSAFQKRNRLVNAGVYILNDRVLDFIDKIEKNRITNEYYFTDIFLYLPRKMKKGIFITNDEDEILGINSPLNLIDAENILSLRINEKHRLNNVFINKARLGPDVIVGPGAKISDRSIILGKSIISKNSYILDSIIEDSFIEESSIGPYAHIINSKIIGSTIGNFVEVKNSEINPNTKVKHLSYIGNAIISENVNIGAGVIFSNYDGRSKNNTRVGKNSFIGSNSTIIAPINIGDDCYIGAGSELTKSLNDGTFYLRRAGEKIYINRKIIENDEELG